MNRRPLSQALLGAFVVAVGVAALLGQLGVVEVSLGELFSTYWPLVIVAIGLVALFAVPRAWIGPVFVIAVGAFFQLDRLDLIDVNVWNLLWPIGIILVGLTLLTRLGSRGDDDDVINSAVIWWGSERRTRSQAFRGGSLSAIMGGIAVDLRQAGLADRADIAVFVLWGGVEIKVPPTWRVRVSGLPVLGGWDDKTIAPVDPHAPELNVHVTSIMGGAEIKN
ncbi:LiaF transmembrane domain-containing protein [Pengzhenrongella sicca]|uniref:LiaF transmembrane domain-containing protein n=1 Tax=Pengzhenrongella sicca TaxID=2819238 RepID=A0A8A4Z7Y9_9MICO|nr:DUF5668 domain-containing protein [Pengzhenrongella sicca]QTE27934.1 hypothetical protein J4E96_10995 [Pengzhenrongella sicca]